MRHAFTLLELLCVLVILAVLWAVLAPVLIQARHKAYQTECLSSLRQLGQATALYLMDYDDRFPSCYTRPSPPFYVDLNVVTQPYLHSPKLLFCPERRTFQAACGGRCPGYGYNWGSGLGWGLMLGRADGLVRSGTTADAIGATLSEVVHPSHTFLAGDTNDYQFITLLRDVMPGVRSPTDPQVNWHGDAYEPPRHFGSNTFVFCDGHVTSLPFIGGLWTDGGPWIVADMTMYER